MVQRQLNKINTCCTVDETTKSLYENTYQPTTKETVQERHREILQRKSASNRERSRMRDMNDAFDMLRNKLNHRVQPPGKKISKIQALRYAIEYIADLEETLSSSTSPTQRNGSEYYHWARTRGFIWAREKEVANEEVYVASTIDVTSTSGDSSSIPGSDMEVEPCF